jgi:hypothetical protein
MNYLKINIRFSFDIIQKVLGKKNPNIHKEIRANRDLTGKLVNSHVQVRVGCYAKVQIF